MRIFLLGATGQTGSILLKDALMRGHNVTVYVRNPEKVFLVNKGLNIIKGDLFSVEDMASVMADHDVVSHVYVVMTMTKQRLLQS